MSRVETDRQLRWLMSLRVGIVTTLLVCAFTVEVLLNARVSLTPLFMLAATAYGMVIVYALADRWLRGRDTFIALQLFGDALLITLFVGITGGIVSPMSFLYLLPISLASMLLYRRGGLATAALCWGLYASQLSSASWARPLGSMVDMPAPAEPWRLLYFLVSHFVAMVAFAMLCAYLADRLRVQGRQLAERAGAVARLKALNENIISSINSGLITTNRQGEINFINRGGVEIIGHSQRDVESRSVESLFSLDEGFLADVRERLLSERRFRWESYFRTKDGRTIYLGVAVSNLFDRASQPIGYIFVFQDLTEIHALEQEMRLKERMVALGEMAAGMAHELRNPLAAISGSVQYLRSDLSPTGEQLELMDIILRESQRLDQAIRDFLTFARPGQFAPERADLVALLDDCVKLLKKSAEFRRDHKIETRFSEPVVECWIDANRMRQVFWNLATNAIKAMPDGGTLRIEVTVERGGELVSVSFADEGVGMDEKQQSRYFQPFSGSFHSGTGLGAAIVYRVVEEHGGKIRVNSDVGTGTDVRIELERGSVSGAPGLGIPVALEAAGG